MADLDGDLQGGSRGSSAVSNATFTQRDADLQSPKGGAYESAASSCTCEAGASGINTEGAVGGVNQIVITFSTTVVLSGPALETENWFVTTEGPGREVRIVSVDFSGSTVTLGTTPQTLDEDYVIHLPTLGITSDVFGIFTGLYSLDFVGVPTPVNVQMVRVVDTHHLDVIFSIAVDEEEASGPTNYTINNGLTCTESVRITDHWYRIRNDPRQVDVTTYTVTISNIGPL